MMLKVVVFLSKIGGKTKENRPYKGYVSTNY